MTSRVLTLGRRSLGALLLCTMGGTGLVATPATAQTNTVSIVVNTAKALPSCLKYKVRGVCFWLKCVGFACKVRTSIRVEHFVPEVVVNTWHDAAGHPWTDVGRPITKFVDGAGSAIVGLPIDSAGTRYTEDQVTHNELFRDADAIGNPLAMLSFLLTGSFPGIETPASFPFPTTTELMAFPSTMGSIGSRWSSVPSTVTAATFAQIKSMANVPATIASLGGRIASIPGALSKITTSAGSLDKVMSSGLPSVGGGSKSVDLPSLGSLFSIPSLGLGPDSIFCPPMSTPFAVHFHSELDALFWRGVVPAEMIYPDSWIPGFNEVGAFPKNTWGAVYPRQGGVTQEHPVKGSAVLAQRVASVISRRAQPHIYAPLRQPGGFRYFSPTEVNPNDPGNSAWQRLYPNAESKCAAFGANDSLSLVAWGDGNTTAAESYSWNLWQRTECCQQRGIFIGSIRW